MAVLDRDDVRFRLELFLDFDDGLGNNPMEPFIDVINNPATRAFYRLEYADFIPQAREYQQQSEQQTAVQSGNVQTRIIEEGRIAKVSIRQMSRQTMEGDSIQLIEFFESIASYEHLIIDIRGNPGGSSLYFPELVIAPNISETLYYHQYMFLIAGEHNMRFLEPRIETGGLQFTPVSPELFDGLPYFHPNDSDILDYYIRISGQINPSQEEAIFAGKAWLLIDGFNFSASGLAAEIVKETGFATLVGRPTSSSGAGLDPTIVALPNSGIIVQYQTMYGTNFQGRNGYEYGTQPHVLNFSGMDALETALLLIEQGEY